MQVTNQQLLVDGIKSIFQSEYIQVNARRDSSLQYNHGAYMELDIWIPHRSICFEFQDPYHYMTTWFYREKTAHRDAIKKSMARKNALTLVTIPCWWKGELESLSSSIYFERPDVQSTSDVLINPSISSAPIPLNPPLNYFHSGEIPDVGSLMLASFPVDEQFNKAMVPNSWWVGEKYDGIRICWNAASKAMYTRSGKRLSFPPMFVPHFPVGVFVDGEIWFGRGQFSATSPLVNQFFDVVEWHILRMVVFDVPVWDLQRKSFEKRYKQLLRGCQPEHPFIIVANRSLCRNNAHLTLLVTSVIQHQGEGVILRRVRSLYQHGRSTSLIKLKTAKGDAEAIVVRCALDGVMLGLPNGKTFSVPNDKIACTPPKVGSVVTFSYEQRNHNDMPVLPSIIRIRDDLHWEDVLLSFNKEKRLNSYSQATSFNMLPSEAWAQRVRAYLESFASKRNLDPLDPSTWYTISVDALSRFKDILNKFHGNYYKFLKYLFPDVEFDKHSFPGATERRSFFENYARVNGFDPHKAENWYMQAKKKLMNTKGAEMIAFFYNNSVSKALRELFPDIGLETSKFHTPPMWHHARNRRKFFEEYGKENGFDPCDPENWYIQPRKKIEAKKGADRVLCYHGQSVPRALLDLFPDIGLDKDKFPRSALWHTEGGRRRFFEDYALEQGFSAHVANNWYSHLHHLMARKGAARVLHHHNLSMAKALLDLFPNIGLCAERFPKTAWRIKKHKIQ